MVPSKGAAPPQKMEVAKGGKPPPTLKRQNSIQNKNKENTKEVRRSKASVDRGGKKSPNDVKVDVPRPKPAAVPPAPPKLPPTKAQQEAQALKQLERKIEKQAQQEWNEQIGVYKRGEAGDAAVQQFAEYYNKIEKRAKADVPGSELLEQSTLGEPSSHLISKISTQRDQSSEKKPNKPQPLRRSILHPDGVTSQTGNETSGRQDWEKKTGGLPTFGDPRTEDISNDSYSEFGEEEQSKSSDKKAKAAQMRREDAQNHLDDIQKKIGQLDGNLSKVINVLESKAAQNSQKDLMTSDSLGLLEDTIGHA